MGNNTDNMNARAVIFACSSLRPFIDAAQAEEGTSWPVIEIDRSYHSEPSDMKAKTAELLARLPEGTDTALIAMGFCGGVWDHVSFPFRIVIPRFDDCVSILLTDGDGYLPNRKETGHLYLYEEKPEDFSALALARDGAFSESEYAGLSREALFHMWFDNYRYMDIIDTGLNDCYTEEYAAAAQEQADRISAELGYVSGGYHVLKKLVSGRWDDQFLIAEPRHLIRHADFF